MAKATFDIPEYDFEYRIGYRAGSYHFYTRLVCSGKFYIIKCFREQSTREIEYDEMEIFCEPSLNDLITHYKMIGTALSKPIINLDNFPEIWEEIEMA